MEACELMQCTITEKQSNEINTLHDETKKTVLGISDPINIYTGSELALIVRAEESLKLSHSGPIQRQVSGNNPLMKVVIECEA